MNTNSVRIYANVNPAQIRETDSHFHISNIPICKNNGVMNDVAYLDSHNRTGMPTLKGKPLTLSHPNVDGVNVSAKSDDGLDFYSGTRIQDKPFLDGGRWFINTSIDKAKLLANNESFHDLIKDRKPFAVSTGLTFEANDESGEIDGKQYKMVAKNQRYDHVALLNPEIEPPAGGEDTTIRGYNSQGEQVDIIVCNAEEYTETEEEKSGAFKLAWNKLKSIFSNETSFGDIDEKIHKKLSALSGSDDYYIWPMRTFTDSFIYRDKSDKLYRQSYLLKDDNIEFVGDRVEQVHVEEFKPVTNQIQGDLMDATKMKELLVANGVSVPAEATEAELEVLLTNSYKPVVPEDNKGGADDKVLSAINALNEKVTGLETQLAANSNKELDGLRVNMKAMTVNRLPDSVIDKLDVKEMNDHLAANGQVAFNSHGQQQQVNNADKGCSTLTLSGAET